MSGRCFFVLGVKMEENKATKFPLTNGGGDDKSDGTIPSKYEGTIPSKYEGAIPSKCDGTIPPKTDPMTRFLSEESIARHREYANGLRLKYSILQKSESVLNSTNIDKIPWQNMKKNLREEAFPLLAEYTLHTVFFSSFAEKRETRPNTVIDGKSAVSELLDRLFRLAKNDVDGGFLVLLDGRRGITPARIFPPYRELYFASPILALDLYEHCYFPDYGFDRARYLLSALSHLDLNLLC